MENLKSNKWLLASGIIGLLLVGMLMCYALFPRTIIEKEVVFVEKPIITEKIVEVVKEVEVEKIVEVPVYIFPEGSGDISDCVKEHNISACCPVINGERVC